MGPLPVSVCSRALNNDAVAYFQDCFIPEPARSGAGSGADNREDGAVAAAAGVATQKDPSLTAVRAKSTMEDQTATVKQEVWNLVYAPTDLTFETMLGKGGLEEVEDAYRWDEYGT